MTTVQRTDAAVTAVQEACAEARLAIDELDAASRRWIAGGAESADRTVAEVERVVTAQLERHDVLVGGGFVAEPARFAGPLMAWWQALGADRAIRRLDPGASGGGEYVRSYLDIEWFRVPRETGRPHMTGPYVDYLCTDEATLTFTAPVLVDGSFYGVLGADITHIAFERRVQHALAAAHPLGLVLTDEGRVAASADPDVLVQRRLRGAAIAGYRRIAVPGTQFSLAVPR